MNDRKSDLLFSASFGQKVLFVVVAINFFILSFFMVTSSRVTSNENNVFSLAQSTSTSMVFTQRETLAFTTKFAQWLGGQIPKRDVLVAKALLAQRLSVVNTDGQTIGDHADPEFIALLKESDQILEKAPEGVLPGALRTKLAIETNSVIDNLLFDSRQMVVSYQQRLDAQVAASTAKRAKNTLNNLYALISLSIFTSWLLIWSLISFSAQYKKAKKTLKDEAEAVLVAEALLKKAESTVKTLEELNISKNNFISTVNHELRTPLTSIIGYVDLLKTIDIEKDAEQLKKITTVIDRNSEVLLEIIESILSLSSLDSPAQMPIFEKINLPQVIDRKIFVLQPLIEQKSIVVNLNYDHSFDFAVSGSTSQISQVVLNLLSNAIKFSPEHGVIDINLAVETKQNSRKYIRLEIKDQGIGIPEAEISKLFTRFFRASNAVSSQVVGTGLGLAIVARILDLHQGTVRVESEVNKGSTFIVELPRYISDVDKHIAVNRGNVLFKAISAIKASSTHELADVCHQMSGALGFYDLENEMEQISDFQHWLEANPESLLTLINVKRDELVSSLEKSYAALEPIEELRP